MTVKLDASGAAAAYSAAFRKLRQLPGFDQRLVLRAEAGSIIKKWAGITKVGTREAAELRARYRAGKRAFGSLGGSSDNQYRITVNTGSRGGVPGWTWYKHPGGGVMLAGYIDERGVIHPNPYRRFKPEAWSMILAGMEAYADSLAGLLPQSLKSIGLARQSVIQIADELGIDLNSVSGQGISSAGIAKARAAIASTGKTHKNGFGSQGGDDVRYHVRLLNRLPFGVKSGMDRQLATVLSGRAKFIETAYKKGAFGSMTTVARSFPNVFKTLRLTA
jgi:hypothetical protein